MQNLFLIFIAVFSFSCQKEEVSPNNNATVTTADTCTISPDSISFSYTLTESNSGYTSSFSTTIAHSTASRCFNESHFLIKDESGADLAWYNFVSGPDYVSKYNNTTVHTLTPGYQEQFTSSPYFPNSSMYFKGNNADYTNASFKVNCMKLIKVDDCFPDYSYYYAEITVTFEKPGKMYTLTLRTVITITTNF